MKRIVTLVCLLLVSWTGMTFGDSSAIRFEPFPGTFHHGVVLRLASPPVGVSLFCRVLIEGSGQSQAPSFRYEAPLYLSALPGMKRSYRISIEARTNGKTLGSVDGVWIIDRTAPPAAGARTTVSKIETAPRSKHTAIPLLSPVAGSFANKQLLYVDRAGFSWVRYSTDGSDPAKEGKPYHSPVLIDRTGSVDLRVAALRAGADKPLTAEVRFTVAEGANPPITAFQGKSAEPVRLSPPGTGDFYYCLAERPPDSQDLQFKRPLTVGSPPGTVSYSVLRLRSRDAEGSWGPQFRYFFAIDRRDAPPPVINLLGGTVATPRTRIRILDAAYTEVYYTTDGSEPDRSAKRYTVPFTPTLPPDSAGTLTVRARAYAPNGTASVPITATYPYQTKTPAPPEATLMQRAPSGAPVQVSVQVPPGSTVVYERTLNGSVPATPTIDSPTAPSVLSLSVPRGGDVDFSLLFASVDSTGNISPPSPAIHARVDERPPAAPTISFSDGRLRLRDTGEIRYVVSDSGAQPPNPGPEAKRYTGSVVLPGKEDERVEYSVAAVAIGTNGVRSEVSRGGPFVVDLRSPGVPVVWGVEAGGIYHADRVMHLEERSGITIHYTLSSNGHPPGEPALSSPVAGTQIQFSVPEGSEKAFVVKLRAAIGTRIGPVETIPFTIDRMPPTIPALQGLPASGIVNHGITIPPPHMALGESLFYSVSTKGKPEDPLGSAGRPFEAPLTLGAPPGGEVTYHIRLGARDAAGNTVVEPSAFSVTIDRNLPPTPVITATPAVGRVTGKVDVTISGSGASIRYELTDDGSEPQPPNTHSLRYQTPLVLEPQDGRTTLYTLLASEEDAAGNLSHAPAVYRVIVVPEAPAGSSEASQHMSPKPGAAASGSPKSVKLVIGAEDGGLYANPVILVPSSAARAAEAANEQVVRYAIDPNGGPPPQVGRFSPELPSALTLDPLPGETRHYAVTVAEFSSADPSRPTGEQSLSFTIDLTHPGQPVISGVKNGGRYDQAKTFTLASSGATIYYSLEKVSPIAHSVPSASGKFEKYTGPVTIGTGKTSAGYHIRAYSVDPAGNRSLATREWTVYFDQGIIFVSPAGSDSAAGTSADPVKTLKRALELSRSKGRGTLFLATGRYGLSASSLVTSSLRLVGNLDPNNWTQAMGAGGTTVTIPADASPGPLFAVEDGTLSLEHLTLHDMRTGSELLLLQGGKLSLVDGSLVTESPQAPIIAASGGTLSLHNLALDNRGGGPLVSVQHTTVDVTGSSFTSGETTGDSVLLSLAGASRASVSQSIFHSASGLRTFSVQIVDSQLSMEHTKVQAGTATRESIGVFARHSTVAIRDSSVTSSAEAHLSFGIQAQGSKLDLTRTELRAQGSAGAIGVWADGSQVELHRSQIVGADTSEFLYLVKISNSSTSIVSSILRGAASGDYLGISLSGSSARIVGNTLFGGSGSGDAAAIALENSRDVDIVDNILARPPNSVGEAISITAGSRLPRIVANDVSGYPVILASPGRPGVVSIDGLNAADGVQDGGPIEANISEPPGETFHGANDLHLKKGSSCIGGGLDPKPYGGSATDYAGAARTAPYNIGALGTR